MSSKRRAPAVVAVSPQRAPHNRALEKKLGLGYPILHDAGNAAAEAYGLRFEFSSELRDVYAGFGVDLPRQHGAGGWELPMPARYVIDPGGTVRYAAVHADYKKRPEPQETLEAVRGL